MQDVSSKQQTKQKYKPNHQQTGLPPHSALAIRGKTNKTSAQIYSIGSLRKPLDLGGQETKRKKKKFNLEDWEKETSNTMLKNSKNEKAEKYHINEGTN